MAESPERELTFQEKLGILRDSLGTVGEHQDSIKPVPGYGTTGEYSITSANKPKR